MASPSVARLVEAPQKYVRLPVGSSNYTIELSTDVLPRLAAEIAGSEKLGIEIGGLLLGSWESPRMARVEDFELVAACPEDGPVYMLSPQQQEQFIAVRQRSGTGKTRPLGFFRSHLRSGPLILSLGDKGFLWKVFRSDPYLALLVDAREPHEASFSFFADGKLALQFFSPDFPPSGRVIEPRKENTVLLAPESLLESSESAVEVAPEPREGRRMNPELLTLCAVLLFAVGVVLWPIWEATFGGPWAVPSSNDVALSIQRHGPNLDVTWNKRMPEISHSEGAVLTLTNGSQKSELRLGKEDLRFGKVAYSYHGGQVQATLALKMQGATSLVQSAVWQNP